MAATSSKNNLPPTPKLADAPTLAAVPRRVFLSSALTSGAHSVLGAAALGGQRGGEKVGPGTIDVHNHFFPPVLKDDTDRFLTAVYGAVPEAIKTWTPAIAIEALDRNGIAKAVVCTSSRPAAPGVTVDQFRATARSCNDYGAKMVQDNPKRFAQFGFLPMPDVDGSLREIEYSLDTLKAPGIGIMTSYGNQWIGDPVFTPVLQELNRRKAVVLCHPRPAACCTNLMPNVASRESQLVEFPYDTGRAVVSLLMSASFANYRDIRWIFCHAGDVVPVLSGRMNNVFSELSPEQLAKFIPQGMDFELRRQFYDTADGAYAPSMAALQAYVPNSQVMFGTDYPYVEIEKNVREIRARHLPAAQMRAVESRNALKLMPQLAAPGA